MGIGGWGMKGNGLDWIGLDAVTCKVAFRMTLLSPLFLPLPLPLAGFIRRRDAVVVFLLPAGLGLCKSGKRPKRMYMTIGQRRSPLWGENAEIMFLYDLRVFVFFPLWWSKDGSGKRTASARPNPLYGGCAKSRMGVACVYLYHHA